MGRHREKGWVSRFVRTILWLAAVCGFCASFSNASVDEAASAHQWGSHHPPPNGCTSSSKSADHFLLVVSTIDGSVSALDMRTSGDILWSVKSDERPLLSASITNIQITKDGVSTRLIPSLDGGLYEFDGEDIKAIPMTADSLLSSSVRLTDNCVMVGGKEIGSYGVDVKTGQLSYQCTATGCKDSSEAGSSGGDMLLITRNMQTVRAVDVNSGSEKWNFSVGQHDLLFVASKKDNPGIEHDHTATEHSAEDEDCVPFDTELDPVDEDHLKQLIKVVVSDGLVVGLNPEDPTQMSWSRKFSSPVAKAWILHRGKLETISLFDSKVVPSLSASHSFHNPFHHHKNSREPLLYVGTHKRQLYVQKQEADDSSCEKEVPWALDSEMEQTSVVTVPRVTWRPYLSNAGHQTPLFGGNKAPGIPLLGQQGTELSDESDDEETSLTVWHENYPFDMGYYLYPRSHGRDSQTPDPVVVEGIMDVLPASLWMWWKEVIAISLITSVVFHFIFARFFYKPVIESLEKKESNDSLVSTDSNPTLAEDKQLPAEFKSRFVDEFECIERLGKGGYGIVFRARNKVDEQEYAVKRIALPNSDGKAKMKMLREVRTLARLDHVGIVRYFHSWIEDPPPGWQEEWDRDVDGVLGTSNGASPTSDHFFASTEVTHQSASSLPPQPSAKPSVLHDIMPGGAGDFGFDLSTPSLPKCATGSGEFSVHSDAEESFDESGSFSLDGDLGRGLAQEESKDSLSVVFQNSDAESSCSRGNSDISGSNQPGLPFRRYKSGKGKNALAHQRSWADRNSDEDSSSIVFEDSGGNNSRDPCKQLQSAVLSDSSYGGSIGDTESGDNAMHKNCVVDFTLSSHGHTNYSDDMKDKEKEEKQSVEPHHKVQPKLYLYIQMQLCQLETLKDWLMANTLNRERMVILDIFEQIVSAVDYVHGMGLIHRDLKPSNIFFALDNTVKVGDFGLVTPAEQQPENTDSYASNKTSAKHTAEVGTQLYMSPEQVKKQPYDQKVDIFSLGMVFLELLIPFSTGMERITTLQTARRGSFPERFCRELPVQSGLVKQLMSNNPETRPTTQEILKHDLLKDFSPRRSSVCCRTISGSSSSNDPFTAAEC